MATVSHRTSARAPRFGALAAPRRRCAVVGAAAASRRRRGSPSNKLLSGGCSTLGRIQSGLVREGEKPEMPRATSPQTARALSGGPRPHQRVPASAERVVIATLSALARASLASSWQGSDLPRSHQPSASAPPTTGVCAERDRFALKQKQHWRPQARSGGDRRFSRNAGSVERRGAANTRASRFSCTSARITRRGAANPAAASSRKRRPACAVRDIRAPLSAQPGLCDRGLRTSLRYWIRPRAARALTQQRQGGGPVARSSVGSPPTPRGRPGIDPSPGRIGIGPRGCGGASPTQKQRTSCTHNR